jgi:hypothetical protein
LLGLIGTDLPTCLIRFMHGSHPSHRENCMIVAWPHVRKAILVWGRTKPCSCNK